MATHKKVNKKKLSRSGSKLSSKSSHTQSSVAARSAHRLATEKMVVVAVISILVIGFVVWFSQDFQAEGQAYRIGLELADQEARAVAIVTSCQTSAGCEYVDSVANGLAINGVSLNGVAVDPYQLVYYDATGNELMGIARSSLNDDGVTTVGYLGVRYPVSNIVLE